MDTLSSSPIEREVVASSLFPRRGLVVAAIAVGLGLCLVKPVGGSIAWADIAVLASMAVVSLVGAHEARRLVQQPRVESELEGCVEPRWMTVVVQSGGPADTAGAVVVPKAPPRKDPERRALTRRAKERKTVGASAR